jgi:hypothetical protein
MIEVYGLAPNNCQQKRDASPRKPHGKDLMKVSSQSRSSIVESAT